MIGFENLGHSNHRWKAWTFIRCLHEDTIHIHG